MAEVLDVRLRFLQYFNQIWDRPWDLHVSFHFLLWLSNTGKQVNTPTCVAGFFPFHT